MLKYHIHFELCRGYGPPTHLKKFSANPRPLDTFPLKDLAENKSTAGILSHSVNSTQYLKCIRIIFVYKKRQHSSISLPINVNVSIMFAFTCGQSIWDHCYFYINTIQLMLPGKIKLFFINLTAWTNTILKRTIYSTQSFWKI